MPFRGGGPWLTAQQLMPQDPQSTTILFTDIEGSTRLWESQPDAMSRALKRHDALARAAVESNSGVVVKMIGDGMYAAFADPIDALNASLALQEVLSDPAVTEGVPLKVRCGLHVGPVEQRDNDFFGPPVNRSARIMSAAHGGQILLSQALVDSVMMRLPAEVALRDLGAVRLKDLASPERVYQVLHPRLRQDFPALRSLEATPNNLPEQLTAFFGRERELAEAGEMLKRFRLVTLLGMGGLGKTRLSLQLAADALDMHPDGAWFVDLAPIQDPSLVPSVVAQVLGVQEEPGRPLIDTLCAHIASRTVLLILDNCEHLIAACAKLANTVLRAAPTLRVLATSREPLHVPGEQTYPILPLPVPQRGADLGELLKSDAVQLFVDRVRATKPAFELSEREAPVVTEIVARLEGIPLALELAAARARALSLGDINVRLHDRFKLLTRGGRVLLERQQTLRALVAWSYDLLNSAEQVLFERICVFAGGWDVEAAEKVCGTDPLQPDDVLDLLFSLVDKSLVIMDERGDGTRYRTLETIRDFAKEKLAARGEAQAIAVRHCEHFFSIAKAARQGIQGADQAEWMRRLESERDNIRAAIDFALDDGPDALIAVKFQVALMNFWILRGYVTEARKLAERSLAHTVVQEQDIGHGHALYVAAALAASQSDYPTAERMLQKCLTLRRGLGNPRDIAATLSTLSHVYLRMGQAENARPAEQEALTMFRELGDRIGEAVGLVHLGQISMYLSKDDEARGFLEQSRELARAIKHCEIEAESDRMLGDIALDAKQFSEALSCYTRSLDACRGGDNKRDEASSSWALARLYLAQGDHARARELLEVAVESFEAFEMHEELLCALEDFARLALKSGETDLAAQLSSAIDANRARLLLVRSPRAESRWDSDMAVLRRNGSANDDAAQWTVAQALQHARIIGSIPMTTSAVEQTATTAP